MVTILSSCPRNRQQAILLNKSEMRLYDTAGNRLYLNAEERDAFLAVACGKPARDRTLCETLHFTGCRPSELVEITPARVDLSGGTITIRSLKKRKDAAGASKIVYRSVPVPPDYLDTLNTAHGIREAQKSRKQASAPIWPLTRVRVWQIVKGIMIEARLPNLDCSRQTSPRQSFRRLLGSTHCRTS
jgi:integrase/recombinase XerD